MSNTTTRFVLVGPYAGKTIPVNGHLFVDGEFVFNGAPEQVGHLTNVLQNYGAYPSHLVEEAQARFDAALALVGGQVAPVAPVVPVVPVGTTDKVDANKANETMPTLGEALAQLDPENEDHWTSNNLPSLEALETLTGAKHARSTVEAVAEGFTRAKARAARAHLS